MKGRRTDVPSMSVAPRSEEHTSELQSQFHLVCRLLLEKKKTLSHPIAMWPDDHHHHINRQEHPNRGESAALRCGDEIADERPGNDHWSRRANRDRDGGN